MTPKLLLRLAAVIMFVHALGHTMGIYNWKIPGGAVPPEVVQSMVDNTFVFQGSASTMAKFYEGMGYSATIALLLVASLLWMLSAAQSTLTVKVVTALIIFLVLLGVDEVIYFFPMAAAFSFVAALLATAALLKIRKLLRTV